MWLGLAWGFVGQPRLGVSVFCDGESLDQVPAVTLMALLNGGLIIFIFKDCSNGCSPPFAGSEVAETFRVRHLRKLLS